MFCLAGVGGRDESFADEHGARNQQHQMQDPAPVPKQPVGDELDEVEGPDAAQHAAKDMHPGAAHHAHLAPILVLDVP